MTRLPALPLMLVLFAACTTTPPSTAPAQLPPAASGPLSTKAALAAEQRRMAELFRGTPVAWSIQADGSLRVAVPLTFCFDNGLAAVKPPLAAVLDRVARSQRAEPTRLRVAAPADPGGRAPQLGKERAASMRDYLMARGVGFTRFAAPLGLPGELVEVVVSDATGANPH